MWQLMRNSSETSKIMHKFTIYELLKYHVISLYLSSEDDINFPIGYILGRTGSY